MLTKHQKKVLHNAFMYANKRSDIENRAMIKDMARLWPEGKVPYAFAADIGNVMLTDRCLIAILSLFYTSHFSCIECNSNNS